MKLSIAVFLGIACSLPAQTKAPSSDAKPSMLRRATSQKDNDLSKYDFNGALQKLLTGNPTDSRPFDPAPAHRLSFRSNQAGLQSPLALRLIGAHLMWS